ncbi:MAG: YggS family pyridoxal phosphate enzyme [Bacteroidota bacterium]|nr:MAG: YggS family pyridoxal phosphate enzyme [Bacteroidota bacterium]HNR73513.1 YggS family pyridoxal phosphate-dependent enzyme [Cyclobacteriaceae bacterium]HNU42389.1 YggS family pyridoxal phosphate-dependent enzyme [Cyclobacteriaceae bacterium]
MSSITGHIAQIKNRIKKAAADSGRNANEVKLLLATKTVSAENIKIAFEAGETLIGENKVQELVEKADFLKTIPHQAHFIGHLQTNKIKEVIRYADCIQSLDRIELAEKLQKRLEFERKTMDVFLQVNTSYEASKFGISPEAAIAFALQVKPLDRLNIKGLMTIGLFSAEPEQVRKCFRLLKHIQDQLLQKDIPVHELSMGMSGDLETAIAEGSTMVRVGTAIFGQRAYPDSYYWNEKNGAQV